MRRFSPDFTPGLRLANTPTVDRPNEHAERTELQQIVRGLEDEPCGKRRYVLLAGFGEHRDARHQDPYQQPEPQSLFGRTSAPVKQRIKVGEHQSLNDDGRDPEGNERLLAREDRELVVEILEEQKVPARRHDEGHDDVSDYGKNKFFCVHVAPPQRLTFSSLAAMPRSSVPGRPISPERPRSRVRRVSPGSSLSSGGRSCRRSGCGASPEPGRSPPDPDERSSPRRESRNTCCRSTGTRPRRTSSSRRSPCASREARGLDPPVFRR